MSAIARVSPRTGPFQQLRGASAHALQKVIHGIGIHHIFCGAIALADLYFSKSWKQSCITFAISEITYSFLLSHSGNNHKMKVGEEEKTMVQTLLYTTIKRFYKKCLHYSPSQLPRLLEKLDDPCGRLQKKIKQAEKNHQPKAALRRKDRLSSLKIDATVFDLYKQVQEENIEKAKEILALLKEKEFKDRNVDEESRRRIKDFSEFLKQLVQKTPAAIAVKTKLEQHLSAKGIDPVAINLSLIHI